MKGKVMNKSDSQMKIVEPDRLYINFDAKIQIKQFEPVGVNIGYASSVLPNETVEECYERIRKFAAGKMLQERKILINAKNKNKGEK